MLPQLHIDPELLDTHVSQSVIVDYIAATLIHSVASFGKSTFSYPANWWEAFKDQYFPPWLKRRFPVQYARVEATGLLPELPLPFKDAPRYTVVGSFLEAGLYTRP